MEPEFEEVAKCYRQGKYQSCANKIKGLLDRKPKPFHSPDDANIYSWIMRSNVLACDYMDISTNGDVQNDKYISVQRSFHVLIKEWLYKSNQVTEIDLVLINNVLQCCSIFFHRKFEENYCIYDNICCAILALRKALSLYNGIDFKPPINICIDNVSFETVALIKDLIKSLPNFEPACRLSLATSLLLILQMLAAANSDNLYKRWALALENLSFLLPDLIQFFELNERITNPNCMAVWTRPVETKSDETCGMEVDFDVKSPLAEPIALNLLKKIPLLTFNILGDAIVYQDDRKAYPLERDITHHLLLTTIVINHLNGYSCKDIEIPFFFNQSKLSDCLVINAWKYIKGLSYYKNGKLKEAMAVMEELDFSSFSSHFKTKKALITASILSKENSHMVALCTLNREAMECHDCLPSSLYTISEEHGFLERKESQLETLRLLFKVLRHKNHLESLNNGQPNMFLKVLDIFHPLPKVTIVTALEKLASRLAHNELYEESAERYLDLLALLEKIGPAKTLLHTIHNAAAVLLLIVGKKGVDRSKDAATLCKRATEIFRQNSSSPIAKSDSSRPNSSENGSPANKRAKLEINVGDVFMELESRSYLEEKVEDGVDLFGDVEQVDDIEVDIFENLQSSHMSHDSIYSSLTSSRGDLTSTILLSECAFRENDFHTSMLLLNRCLHILNKQQLVERSKVNSRDCFLETTDFIISHIWLRKAKILMKRESTEKLDFAKDIEHCIRNARIHNSDDAEIVYYYLKYKLAAGKIEFLNLKEITANVQFNSAAFSSTPPTEKLAIWYIFRPTVTKDQHENLLQQIKESHPDNE